MKVIFWLSVMADVKRQHAFLPYLSRQEEEEKKKNSQGKQHSCRQIPLCRIFRWICEACCWNILVNSTRHFSMYAVVQPLMDKKTKAVMFSLVKHSVTSCSIKQKKLNLIDSESFPLTASNQETDQSYPACEHLLLHC